jgi:hypothetical protein
LKRITKAALGGVAGCALVLGGTQAATGISSILQHDYGDIGGFENYAQPGPFDGASANLVVRVTPDATDFRLTVTDIDETAAGDVFGAHLHTDACDDTSSGFGPGGPHYNHEVNALGIPRAEADISPKTEVWFKFVPNASGDATDDATVSFLPVDEGAMSIVVHLDSTNRQTGGAGLRQACFPVDVRGVFPSTVTE